MRKGLDNRTLILSYVYLAVGTAALGTFLTFLLVPVCAYFGIDLARNIWLLAVPSAISLFVNVALIEFWIRRRD